jgi:glycosyltransferase involved in cell wall biosynthesis
MLEVEAQRAIIGVDGVPAFATERFLQSLELRIADAQRQRGARLEADRDPLGHTGSVFGRTRLGPAVGTRVLILRVRRPVLATRPAPLRADVQYMKILFLSPYPPARDGIGDYTAALAVALVAEGHAVRVIAARRADSAPDEVIGVLPRTTQEQRALLEAVDRWKPDLVHVQFAVAAYGAGSLRLPRLLAGLRDLGLPIVLTLHEITRDLASLRAAGTALYARVVGDDDVVVVHADAALPALRRLRARPGGTAVVIPHPRAELPVAETTAAARRTALALDGAQVVLAFGFIHVDKALDDLVRALVPLTDQARREDVRLLVAGTVRPRNGPFRLFELRDHLHLRQVRRLVASTGLATRVVFSGYVARGDIVATFQMADVVVLPYRRIEDSGVANLAAASGARIVATDIGNLPQYVAEPRWLTPVGRPESLAAAIGDALDTPPSDGAQTLPGASFDDVLAQTVALYRRTASTSTSGIAA